MNRARFLIIVGIVAVLAATGAVYRLTRAGLARPITVEARRAWWDDAKVGLMIHFGPYAQLGIEASLPLHDRKIPRDQYEALANTFNPDRFDAKAIAALARRAGAKYVIFTAKHHDGFAMYDTRLSPYRVTQSPIRRDLARELADAVRAEGLGMGFYFSIPDWHNSDYYDSQWPTPRRLPRLHRPETLDSFVAFYAGQISELLEQYAPVSVLWFDGAQMPDCQYWYAPDLVDRVRRIDPACLLNERGNLAPGYDFRTVEGVPSLDAGMPDAGWEAAVTITDQWAWKPDAEHKTTSELIRSLAQVVGRGGNFLLNIGPAPTGEIDRAAIERLTAIGRWLERNGEAIYGTRIGPTVNLPGIWTTRRGGRVYLLADPDVAPRTVAITQGHLRLTGARCLTTGEPLPHTLGSDGKVMATLPGAADEPVSVVALKAD